MPADDGEEVPPKADKMRNDEITFYKLTRAQIEHEDALINHRMTWLLTLQAFLFGAYGVSFGAESVAQSARISRIAMPRMGNADNLSKTIDHLNEVTDALINHIHEARTVFAVMTFISSIALLSGIGAAAVSMGRLVRTWKDYVGQRVDEYPQIIGDTVPYAGRYAGLVPPFLLPVATSAVWLFLEGDNPTVKDGVLLVVIIALLISRVIFHFRRSE